MARLRSGETRSGLRATQKPRGPWSCNFCSKSLCVAADVTASGAKVAHRCVNSPVWGGQEPRLRSGRSMPQPRICRGVRRVSTRAPSSRTSPRRNCSYALKHLRPWIERLSAVTRFDASAVTSIPLLLRCESVATSRIEQLTSLSRKIFEAEPSGSGSANSKLIVANVRQMQRAIEVDTATTEKLLAMHSVFLQDAAPKIAGRLRE